MNNKINVADISELRTRTGVGLSNCKKALIESGGDISKASELLRQKGLASTANKAGKIAAEGSVVAQISSNSKRGVLLELNSQTDFVAKNENFKGLLGQILEIACENKDINSLEELKEYKISTGETINDLISLKTAQIGEKLELRRLHITQIENDKQQIFEYTHPLGSKIAVLGLGENIGEIAKDLAMHIAAFQPQPEFLQREDIPEEKIATERRIEEGKEDLANKPAEIKEKIITGRVEKALMEKVLLEQPFVKDQSKKIKDLLKENNASILNFKRFNLGEGIDKKECNFADEVAAQMQAK